MTYVRKTRDEWNVQGNYGYGHGWEDVACYDTLREAMETLRDYRENEPQYPHRVRCVRVRIGAQATSRKGRA